jgi:hypothetical protein
VAIDDLIHPQGVFQGVEILIFRKVGRIDGLSSAGDRFSVGVGSSSSVVSISKPSLIRLSVLPPSAFNYYAIHFTGDISLIH